MNAAAPRQGAGVGGATDAGPGIVLDGVSVRFGGATGREALHDLSLVAAPQTFTALLGPSGCGKTTVLRLADGLIRPTTGKVRVFGQEPKPGPATGLVFQSYRLIPWATVRGNVAFGLKAMPLTAEERRDRVERHLELVGLARVADAYPHQLSGGMKQRVALARALAPEPQVLLMDEPFASIDAQTRELMQIELMQLWTERRPLVLFVTHSVDEAILLADRIALLGPSPGHVVEMVDVGLERPRWTYDARADPRFVDLRRYLTARLREFVFSDPKSEFFGRDPLLPKG
jgi:NitT/TauT family transport system ATP-binding protein